MRDAKIPLLQFDTKKAQDIPFEIFRIEAKTDYDDAVMPFRHEFYVIVVLTEGTGTTLIDFKAYPIQGGGIYFITPGQVQHWETTSPVRGFSLLFMESFLPMDSTDSITPRQFDYFHRTDLAPVLFLADVASEMNNLCESMLRAYHEMGFGRTALLQSYLRIFLIQSQRFYAHQRMSDKTTVADSLVTNYIRLIDAHFIQKQRVSEYASLLGVTSGHLTDITRDKLGVSAGQLIQRRVLLEAKRLLTYSEKTVGEIAFALNFTDSSYFSRYFRRETGQSPSMFRAEIREKYLPHRSES